MARTGSDANPNRSGADQPTNGELSDAENLEGFPLGPVVGARPAPVEDPATSEGERDLRRSIRDAVGDVRFPASREDLLAHVGPDRRSAVLGHLRALPAGIVFGSPEEVARAFGGMGSSA